ncbi:MAG TPA: polysaccharide ABC transporter ATP-binding protein [Gemmatimonadaceae bacterium]|nr:polysaccharide ABC transporter ATP-binding protein [Gemmatimonadaceae bacterium]
MAEPAVIFDHVWKKFRRGQRHDSLRDLVPAIAKGIFRRRSSADLTDRSEFWALRDISFEVRAGEALGIIGSNGAGKSTTLKLLTRILKPTRGRCEIHGRCGALIEIAAGFHPDLTGRENIYLQGAIMGMRRHEIARKFDEIVEFSGIADFIDTQVKRYSSGMNARLGFSVAAHLEPDVLLIDEVLSVGDFAFQQRAFDRMKTVVRSGIPVVVVSHQLERVASLCTHGLLLQRGQAAHYGPPADCIAAYVMGQAQTTVPTEDCPVHLDAASLGSPRVRSGEYVTLTVSGHMLRPVELDEVEPVGLSVRALHTGQQLFACGSSRFPITFPEAGAFEVEVDLQMNVPVGKYLIETVVWDRVHERAMATGPSVMVDVAEGAGFWGSVQLNPRMRFTRRSAVGEETGALR